METSGNQRSGYEWSREGSQGQIPPVPQHNLGGPPYPARPDQPRRANDGSRRGVFRRGWGWFLKHPVWAGISGVATILSVILAAIALFNPSPPSRSDSQSNNTQAGDRCSANGNHITISCSDSGTIAAPSGSGPVPVNSKPDPNSPLQLATVWPWITGCPAMGSAVAMPVGGGALQDFHSSHDLGPTLAASGAGSWVQGSMYLHLKAATGKRLEIVDLRPHIQRRDLAPPAWVYIEREGCGPYPGDRVFALNLDKPLLTDTGVEDSNHIKAGAPTVELGTGFVVDDRDDIQIRLDSLACKGNYQWTIEVRYSDTDTGEIKSYEVGPVTSYGRADNTIRYEGSPGPDGVIQVKEQTTITGADPFDPLKGRCHAD
jgi:hypothetical protein